MANHENPLHDVFFALGDPTRLAIVAALGRGPEPVSVLAAPFAMALPSFMKHIAVLESCGVVSTSKSGRVRTCELVPHALEQAEDWIARQRALWAERSDRMARLAEQLHRQDMENTRAERTRRREHAPRKRPRH